MEQHKNLHLAALTLDRQQAVAHLEALGYKQGDAVYVRAFLPKEDPRYAPNTGRKADRLNWEQVERWQAQGYGVYIVVNGGGHKDEDVKSCRAIFCEFDDRAIEDQINFWQDLGLPEPSLQIATRKSVHTYWVFDEPLAVERWRELQTALLAYTGSDPALKNPSRVMRLAGAYHIKPGCDPLRCDIIHCGDKRYSYQELRAAIPVPKPLLEIPPVPPQSRQYAYEGGKRYEDISIPVPVTVPLEVCLAKESRALLKSGVGEGGRNAQGAKLARDLIGTASYLQSIGQSFDGDPRLLLEDYANRCSPPLPLKEVETVWKSAEKDNPTPSCTPEGVEACIRGWYWKHHVKPQQESTQENHNYAAGRGFGNTNNRGKNKPPVATITLCDRIREILNREESESVIASRLIELAAVTGRTYNEINQLSRIIRTEGELAVEVIEAVESFRPLLKSSRSRLNIPAYIDRTLSNLLMAKAAAMPTAPEYLFNTVLPSSASRIGTAARVVINPEGGYTQPCIFWTANVAHSGQAKTPPQQAILKPLEEMEATAKESHDIQMEDYENDKDAEGKPPGRQRRLLNNVTTSTKIRIHDENPRGLLEYMDELVADYQRLNQFKNGKGDDLQLELSFWNGSGGNFDRHDARLFLKRVALSKTGTYQWDTLARLMADEVNFIASGYSSRFLYCSIVDAPARFLDLFSTPNLAADQLREKLSWLYAQLEQLPETDYFLSHEAKILFQGWNHTLVNAEMEEKHFGLSLVYAKIESYTARIALWLHIVNAVLRGEPLSQTIGGRTMQHAIEIALFYLDQHKLIHAHNAPNRQLEGIFLKVQTQAEKFFTKGSKGVGASFLKTRINALKNWAVEKIRCSIFQPLAAAGHGRIEGEGSEMVYIPNTPTDDIPRDLVSVGGELVASPIAQTTGNSDLQASIGEIGEDSAMPLCPPLRSHCVAPVPSVVASGVQLSGEDTRVPLCPRHREVSGGTTTEATFSQPSTEAIASPSDHQFTNGAAETITVTNLGSVGDTTNSSPIAPTEKTRQQQPPTARELAEQIQLCSTWIEIARLAKENTDTLIEAAKKMTATQRQGLTKLLVEHLCQFPCNLHQLTWVPERLRQRAIEKLSFTIRCVTSVMEGALDAARESISGCRLKYIDCIGTQNEVWVFTTLSGEDFCACPNAVEVVVLHE